MAGSRELNSDQEIEMKVIPSIKGLEFISEAIEEFINHLPKVNIISLLSFSTFTRIDWIKDLPTELWLTITNFLPAKEIIRLSSTSKVMRSFLIDYKGPRIKEYTDVNLFGQEESPVTQLPHELLLLIYNLLDIRSTLHLSMTCKLFSILTNDDGIRLRIFLEKHKRHLPEGLSFEEILKRYSKFLRNDYFNRPFFHDFNHYQAYADHRAYQRYDRLFRMANLNFGAHDRLLVIDNTPEVRGREIRLALEAPKEDPNDSASFKK